MDKRSTDAGRAFLDFSLSSLIEFDSLLLQLREEPHRIETIDKLHAIVSDISGGSGIFGFEKINRFAHQIEVLLRLIRRRELSLGREVFHQLMTGSSILWVMIESLAARVEFNYSLCDTWLSKNSDIVQGE